MRIRTLAIVSSALLAVLAAAAALDAQGTSSLAADLARDWSAQKARIIALAEAMPADKWDYKATDPQRTYGEQLHHLAVAHVNMLKALDPDGRVPAPQMPATHGRDEVIRALGAAYDYGSAVITATPSVEAAVKPEGPTAARTIWAAMNNAMNHYGQCVVYLRLNGIVPPASRR
jgi:uncharacterized damage-inducible protein DinB